ncbi:MAG: glycogen debranching protein GlgX [Acidimicrobiia bacterium]|nr:glycogen debranching protein GlgX [Acidimicrobiia bacterium]
MIQVHDGRPSPLGASVEPDGVNFSVFSRSAEAVQLALYDGVGDPEPRQLISLDPSRHRTYHYWHVFVPGLGPGQLYAFRAHGSFDPARGHRFDPTKTLLDPYGRAVAVPSEYRRAEAVRSGPNDQFAFKSVVADPSSYDWEGDGPLRRPFTQTVIYEMHVRGFTANANSGIDPAKRGTYAGVIEKIPYLQELGFTAVELMPVFQFDAQDAPAGLTNYWGYAPVSFFAPHSGYASVDDPLRVLDEFRDMVKALHRAGIEVILDVVYNHTAEAGEAGPTISFRGLENPTYYILDDGCRYANYSGTGNTLNANRPVVRRMILDSLHYWVEHMHVDGFRFDLASVLSRDEEGRPLPNPPILWDIESDPVLAGTKLIAEAWDAAGLYQVGNFVGDSWKEWNGRFRDDVRAFVRGEPGKVRALADRLLGSPDMYSKQPREPERSINFVTSHDGFTLNDLVSYDHKHNEANLEGNRDGMNDNVSWNCGVEGPTDDPAIEYLRDRQIRNLLAITILSLGAPMLLMGDEVRRTQGGDNNAYCQDNEISWFDWDAVESHADLIRFVRLLISVRSLRESVATDQHLTLAELLERAQVRLHGITPGSPDLSYHSRSLALSASNLSGDPLMYFALSAYWEPLRFQLPDAPEWAESGWCRVVDTSLSPPDDIVLPTEAPPVKASHYDVRPRSIVVLFATSGPRSAS